MRRLPLYGISLFLALYVTAALRYPGGTKDDPHSVGFSLIHNYWCDLFDPVAYNGMVNPARPVAEAAMVVLALGMVAFWHFVPLLFQDKRRKVWLTRGAGYLSMGIALLLSTPYHDAVIHLAGTFGILALGTVLLALYEKREHRLFALALVALAFCLVNFLIWRTGYGLFALAALQKVAFLIFFAWVWLTTLQIPHERQH